MIRFPFLPVITLALLLSSSGHAGSVDDDWAAVVAMDEGPKTPMRSQAEAQIAAATHIERQEAALRAFLREHPKSPQAFEAHLRLSRALQIRWAWQKVRGAREEAESLLAQAAKIATPEQKVEVDFARLTLVMRTMKGASAQERDQLLSAARRFQSANPGDRRVPMVLLEVASLFDHQPRTKRTILVDAQAVADKEADRIRIADELKKLDLLGAPVHLQFKSVQGKEFNIAQLRGKVVALIFFADWSPPSITALKALKTAVHGAPAGQVQLVGVSLDKSTDALAQLMNEHAIDWPVAFDGKGWMSPLARDFGVNALPTVWLIDPQGRLRSLKGQDDTAGQ
ncbi:MAG: TlpA family protein disulfide reductase, partial [Chthoniobacteraceae bacterium]